MFFIDLEGHIDQENVAAALDEIRPNGKRIASIGFISNRCFIVQFILNPFQSFLYG